MNTGKLYRLLAETTVQLRKGDEVETSHVGPVEVVEVFAMPSVSEAKPELEKVDLEFLVIGVDRAEAEKHRAEFIELLDTYPEPERLQGGPSYIEVGAAIGDQGAAFQLFALGKVLGLWDIITPKTLGFTGQQARDLAGSGFIMITGYDSAKAAV
jgi:hypothetical protein